MFLKSLIVPVGPLSSSTTSKEHYKQWPSSPRLERTHTEYPSLAGVALFPTNARQFSTSTGDFHRSFEITERKAAAAKSNSRPDVTSSLKMEGN